MRLSFVSFVSFVSCLFHLSRFYYFSCNAFYHLRKKLGPGLLLLFAVSFPLFANAAPKAELWSFWQAEGDIKDGIDHSAWQKLLDNYLDAKHPSGVNRFDYQAVLNNENALQELNDYLAALQELDPRKYSKASQMAYWINLYNAITVQRVLADYPVSSITKLGGGFFSRGPWDEPLAKVAGKSLSLNDIEHRILRPIWKDERIHFAVNCASIGCPNLAEKAYTRDNIEALLASSARDYLAHERGSNFDGNTLVLSKIFDWYQQDFGDSEKQMLAAIAKYAPKNKAARIQKHSGRVKYQYDWALNKP